MICFHSAMIIRSGFIPNIMQSPAISFPLQISNLRPAHFPIPLDTLSLLIQLCFLQLLNTICIVFSASYSFTLLYGHNFLFNRIKLHESAFWQHSCYYFKLLFSLLLPLCSFGNVPNSNHLAYPIASRFAALAVYILVSCPLFLSLLKISFKLLNIIV